MTSDIMLLSKSNRRAATGGSGKTTWNRAKYADRLGKTVSVQTAEIRMPFYYFYE